MEDFSDKVRQGLTAATAAAATLNCDACNQLQIPPEPLNKPWLPNFNLATCQPRG